MKNILIVQTAFIGDVILSTSLIEKISKEWPGATIDFLLRKGNEGILENNPHVRRRYIWDKKRNKYKNLFAILHEVKKENYDVLINLQRHFSTGLFSALSKSKIRIGFVENPLSFLYHFKEKHFNNDGRHEIQKIQSLVGQLAGDEVCMPRLYSSNADKEKVAPLLEGDDEIITISPSSVWYTKELPTIKWVELVKKIPDDIKVFILGGPNDWAKGDEIIRESKRPKLFNYCGKLNFLESAVLMEKSKMNYVNDSAPLHIASSVNARITAFFCSTSVKFGYGPLSQKSNVAEIDYKLDCRPCGPHGRKTCPRGHFKCAHDIDINKYVVQ